MIEQPSFAEIIQKQEAACAKIRETDAQTMAEKFLGGPCKAQQTRAASPIPVYPFQQVPEEAKRDDIRVRLSSAEYAERMAMILEEAYTTGELSPDSDGSDKELEDSFW